MPIIFITGHGDVRMTVEAMKTGALGQQAKVREIRDSYASLSRRQRQVMELVVRARLNKRVDSELGISEITVKAHRGQAMQPLASDL
jgi:FixJ family two-component response regulator